VKCAYVYYRIDPAQAALAAGRVDALLAAMAEHCGPPPRRLIRCDDPATWMEIFEGIADFKRFEAALNASAQTFNCAAFTRGDRHLECFVPANAATSR
jgi:ABC-type amino acid transport substrate-binding protein